MTCSVAISCLLLAAKYHCETEDIIINIDIARALHLCPNPIGSLRKLNAMEAKMLELLDFRLFVSAQDFNKV